MNAIERLRARFQRPGGSSAEPQPVSEPAPVAEAPKPKRFKKLPPPVDNSPREFSDKFYCEASGCECAKLYKVESKYKEQHLKKYGEAWPYPAWKCPKCGDVKEQHCAEGLYHPHGFMSSCGALCDL